MKNKLVGLALVLSGLMSVQAMASDSMNSGSGDPLVVIALVKVKPGTQDAFKAEAEKIIASTREEAGNIDYNFQQSNTDPTQFSTIEHWKSQADLDAHMKLPFMQNFFQAVGGYFEVGYPDIRTYTAFGN